VIFIDRSIPRSIADQLKEVRDDVLWLEDRFPHDVPDEVWLEEAGRRGWLVITHDARIRTRPGERRAIAEHGTGCFILTYKQDLTKTDILAVIVSVLEKMEALFSTTPRPFIYTVNKDGEFRKVV
jgi:predicted nuclease of predicted toxin-antitoxin system